MIEATCRTSAAIGCQINEPMRRILTLLLFTASLPLFGQTSQENVLYVTDSVAIVNDPDEDDGELMDNDIETVTVVTTKSEIEKHGYKDLDKIIFIITKEYASRSDDLKRMQSRSIVNEVIL